MAMDTVLPDLEKGIEEGMVASDAQLPAMVGGGEKELLIPPDLPIDGGVVAANMNTTGLKKWLPYWLITGSVIVLTNSINAAPKYQLIPPELAVFVVFLCAICSMFRAMKQVM